MNGTGGVVHRMESDEMNVDINRIKHMSSMSYIRVVRSDVDASIEMHEERIEDGREDVEADDDCLE